MNLITLSMEGKLPPQAIDLEEIVIGAAMLEKTAFGKVSTILDKKDFYKEQHSIVWDIMSELYNENLPIDIMSVIEKLRSKGKLDLIGGAHFISQLTIRVASAANIEYHSTIIKQLSLQRNIIELSTDYLNKAWENGIDPFEFSKEFAWKLENITSSLTPDMRDIGKVAKLTYSMMREASLNESDIIGYPSSISALNDKLLGYSAPDFTIVAAGTGEGKSTFMLNEVKALAKQGIPCAVFSLEMNDYQLLWKMFSSDLDIDVKSIRKGKMDEGRWDSLSDNVKEYAKMPVYFYDSGGLTIEKFCGIVKEAVRKNGVKMVFIDYIQLLMVQNAKDFGNREAQVNFISKRIKRLARELSIPIMALSQLSRLEKGTKRKYKLSDLRESGALEQDSDNVIFLYNPSYHGVEEMEFYDKNENGNYEKQTIAFDHEDCLILIEKCRLGETGIVRCKFKGQFSRHEDLPNSQRIQKTEDFSFNDRPF